jgi:hypothetical protein
MSGGKAPTPPDPQKTAGAQTGSNIQTAIANQYMNSGNMSGPGYKTTRSQTGTKTITGPDGKTYSVPIMSQNTSLTGKNEDIYNKSQNATLRTAKAANSAAYDVMGQNALNFNGIQQGGGGIGMGRQDMVGSGPGLVGNVAQGDIANSFDQGGNVNGTIANAGKITNSYSGDFAAQRDEVQNALMARMNPSLTQDKDALEARLASQGIGIGSSAYEAAMGDYSRQTNDARMSAILGAGDEQARLVGMERDRAGFQNSAQAQQFGQNAARSGFANDAVAQRYAQNQGAAQFANNAQGQQFGQDMQQVGLKNAARQGMYDNKTSAISMNNQSRTQQQVNDLRQSSYADSMRARDINERMTLRNDPMQRLQSLAGLGQAQQAPMAGMPQGQVANTDIAGLINANYGAQSANYQNQQKNKNQLWGGILGAGAAIFSG